MGIFKKKKKVSYTPQGRLGYFHYDNWPYTFTVILEEIGVVGDRSKIRILEVDIAQDCGKNKKECLNKIGFKDWILSSRITWETTQQKSKRLGTPISYEMNESDLEEKVKYRMTPLDLGLNREE